jgi:protein-tyrosine phosphatase
LIDIHCHILPGVDDGASDMKASLEMAKAAVEEGITTIIATPHLSPRYQNHKTTILQKVQTLNETLKTEKIPLTILPGQEPRIYGEMVEDYESGKLLTLNDGNKYIFVELPSNHVPRYTKQLLFDIQLKGLTPIIVHPERNQEVIEHPDVLYSFVKDGTLTQITASSITGHFGKKVKKFSLELVENNLTHFIASDAHNITSRAFRLQRAYEEVENEFGVSQRYLLQENAEYLLNGENVVIEIPERVKKKKFFGLF